MNFKKGGDYTVIANFDKYLEGNSDLVQNPNEIGSCTKDISVICDKLVTSKGPDYGPVPTLQIKKLGTSQVSLISTNPCPNETEGQDLEVICTLSQKVCGILTNLNKKISITKEEQNMRAAFNEIINEGPVRFLRDINEYIVPVLQHETLCNDGLALITKKAPFDIYESQLLIEKGYLSKGINKEVFYSRIKSVVSMMSEGYLPGGDKFIQLLLDKGYINENDKDFI